MHLAIMTKLNPTNWVYTKRVDENWAYLNLQLGKLTFCIYQTYQQMSFLDNRHWVKGNWAYLIKQQ